MKALSGSPFICKSEEETLALGEEIGRNLQKGDVLVLTAPLGAGKTLLTKGIARGLGIEEPVTSPSFTIINEYAAKDGGAFYHIDVWRLSGGEDFEAAAGPELFNDSSICVIEWGERLGELLPEKTIRLSAEILESGARRFTMNPPGTP